MGASLLGLIGGTSLAWLAIFVFGSESFKIAATLAIVITLPPVALTYATIVGISRRWPDSGPAMVLGGTVLRMVVAVGSVAILNPQANSLRTNADALGLCVTGFYLLTLSLETGLLWRALARPGEVAQDGPTAPTGQP